MELEFFTQDDLDKYENWIDELYRIRIPVRLDGRNEEIKANRNHYRVGAALKRKNMELCYPYIKNQCKKKFEKIQIGFAWHIKNKRRDPDNIRSADKYVLDALVQSEVIPDDNLKHVVGFLGDIFILNKDCDKVEIFIKEIE